MAIVYCNKCGTENKDIDNYCKHCGTKLEYISIVNTYDSEFDHSSNEDEKKTETPSESPVSRNTDKGKRKIEKEKYKTKGVALTFCFICVLIICVGVVIGIKLSGDTGEQVKPVDSKLADNDDTFNIEDSNSTRNKEPLMEQNSSVDSYYDKIINVWSFNDEVPNMVQKYIDTHPDCGFDLTYTIIATTDGAYQPALDQALVTGDADAPDIYAVESAFVLKYTQGDASKFAMPYENLGIDVSNELRKADIAQYSVDIGTRTSDNKLVGLGFQATGGAFIYRRSIAKDIWGTDDPKTVAAKIGAGTDSWDTFYNAALEAWAKGYSIVSGDGEIWHSVENSADKGWIVGNKLTIDPKREAFLDLSKQINERDFCNGAGLWSDAWFADMQGKGKKKVLGFFGPVWMINYTIAPNCGEDTYGDWAVCLPPSGFFYGGTWLLAHKDTKNIEDVRKIIEWITLDCTENGLQYMWANGKFNGDGGVKDCVASGTVMSYSDGRLDFLGGQNMFDIYVKANQMAKGNNVSQYDEEISTYWKDQVSEYVAGNKSREQAISDFKRTVAENLDVIVE